MQELSKSVLIRRFKRFKPACAGSQAHVGLDQAFFTANVESLQGQINVASIDAYFTGTTLVAPTATWVIRTAVFTSRLSIVYAFVGECLC